MWNQSTSEKLAKILQLIANPPNLRPHPSENYVSVFDGGLIKNTTGINQYEFSDGTRAFYGTTLNIALTVQFANGEEINIKSNYSFCTRCRNPIVPTVKCCNQCGQKNSSN